jgi:pectate lyase
VGTLTDGSSVVKLHPKLLTTGVSGCYINPRISDADYVGLTIFSANGSAIRHCGLNVKATANIIIRNLKFDEYWEWDEQGKGQYDKNNWDFIVLSSGGGTVDHVWVDHCTFTVAYDGCADNKGGVSSVTYSWCKYAGDDGASNTNSFVRQQINALEAVYQVNPATNAMYSFLRSHGFSVEDIVQVLQGSKKGTAVGETSLNPVNVNASVTFHHNWFNNMWDRHPRLAGGTVHLYNSYIYCTDVLAARRMRDARSAAMSPANQYTMENTYSFKPSINGSISTEDGAMLVEKSVYIDNNYPLRNNQTDPNNPIYTGKIKALDTIYRYDSTYVRGNSTDPGNPLGPFQAPIKPFSWNTNAATPGGQLPYTAPMDDPAQLQSIVTSPTAGAGAGVLTWAKTNWLKTTY